MHAHVAADIILHDNSLESQIPPSPSLYNPPPKTVAILNELHNIGTHIILTLDNDRHNMFVFVCVHMCAHVCACNVGSIL